MTIRNLPPEEWQRLRAIFAREFGENPPHVGDATVVVAETEQGEIVGLLTVQLIVHAEPIWVKRTHRSKYIVPQLINKARELLPTLNYCFAQTTNARVGRFLERLGFTKMPSTLYRWLEESNGQHVRTADKPRAGVVSSRTRDAECVH